MTPRRTCERVCSLFGMKEFLLVGVTCFHEYPTYGFITYTQGKPLHDLVDCNVWCIMDKLNASIIENLFANPRRFTTCIHGDNLNLGKLIRYTAIEFVKCHAVVYITGSNLYIQHKVVFVTYGMYFVGKAFLWPFLWVALDPHRQWASSHSSLNPD